MFATVFLIDYLSDEHGMFIPNIAKSFISRDVLEVDELNEKDIYLTQVNNFIW